MEEITQNIKKLERQHKLTRNESIKRKLEIEYHTFKMGSVKQITK